MLDRVSPSRSTAARGTSGLGTVIKLLLIIGLVVVLVGFSPQSGDDPVNNTSIGGDPAADETHPWGNTTIVVGIENQVAPSENLTGPVRTAIRYWANHSEYTAYEANFVLNPNATNPDLIVRYKESVVCASQHDVVGCAPVLNQSQHADPPETIRIQDTGNKQEVTNTITHEFGHVLGITHCEPPHWLMSASCSHAIPDAPDVQDRQLSLRDPHLTVYVDSSNVSDTNWPTTQSQIQHTLEYFESGAATETNGSVSFQQVESRWAADVVITVQSDLTCNGQTDVVACVQSHGGSDFDNDGVKEYYTGITVTLDSELDADARGWHVGWALTTRLFPAATSPVFEGADYHTRRSAWWEET